MRPAKFDRIAKSLEGAIMSGAIAPGARLPSQSELCSNYKVSRSCVQKALDVLDAKRLLERRPGKGIHVKGASEKSAEANPFKNVALVLHDEFRTVSSTYDNFGLEMLWGVLGELRLLGANCILRKEGRDSDSLAASLDFTGADAFIVDRVFKDSAIMPLKMLGRPVAVLGRFSPLSFVSSSFPNHADCLLKLFVRLAQEDFNHVGMVYAPNEDCAPDIESALNSAKDSCPSAHFSKSLIGCPLGGGFRTGIEGALQSLFKSGSPRPQVIVFSSDWYAAKALEILKRMGLSVPGDIGIIGCYGLQLGAASKPHISSLWIDPGEIGRRAVRLLADSAIRSKEPAVERVPFELMERDSFRWPLHNDESKTRLQA